MALCKVNYSVIARDTREVLAVYETYTKARGYREAGKKTEQKAIAHFESILGEAYWETVSHSAWYERNITPLETFANR